MPPVEMNSSAPSHVRPTRLPHAVERVLTHRLEGAIEEFHTLGSKRKPLNTPALVHRLKQQRPTLLEALDAACFEKVDHDLDNHAQRLAGKMFAIASVPSIRESPLAMESSLRRLLTRLPKAEAAEDCERIGLYRFEDRTGLDFGFALGEHMELEIEHGSALQKLQQALEALPRGTGAAAANNDEAVRLLSDFEDLAHRITPVRPRAVLRALREAAEHFPAPEMQFLAVISLTHIAAKYPSANVENEIAQAFSRLRAHDECTELLAQELESIDNDDEAVSHHRALCQGVAAIRDEGLRADLLHVLTRFIPAENEERVFNEILTLAHGIHNEAERGSLFTTLAAYLPDEHAGAHFLGICGHASALTYPNALEMWTDLAECTPQLSAAQTATLGAALRALRRYPPVEIRAAFASAVEDLQGSPMEHRAAISFGRFAQAIPDATLRKALLRGVIDASSGA